MSKLGEPKSKLIKQLKCLSEDFDKYTADASKQSDFKAMKKLSERWRAVKDNLNMITII